MLKQLSGLDASFLYLETGRSFGHVNSLSIYSRPDDPGYDPHEAFRAQLEARLGVLEPLRRRLVNVPFELDHPYWINDPDFDIDFHIRHIAVPDPGDDDQLGELVARLIGRPMDRSRPLWEVYVIEGLGSGDFAVLTKLHHATIDGAAGAEMLTMILDDDPDAAEPDSSAAEWSPDPVPTQSELLRRTAVEYATRPGKAVRLQIRALRELGRITRNRGFDTMADNLRRGLPGPLGGAVRKLLGTEPTPDEPVRPPNPLGLSAPRTPFNHTITPHRRFAFAATPLADVKAIKSALGVTVNDVVMAVCAGGLRRYLESHDALPDENLVAMVPVSIRTGDETEKWTNRVSAIFATLPTTEPDPLARVDAVHQAMVAAKDEFDLTPAELLLELSELAPAALAVRAARVAARTRVADRLNPPANLVVSNVPGPRRPLYLRGGARLEHYYPVSTVVDGQGLNITVQSYLDTLDFGLVSCRELVPDLWDLLGYCIDEIGVLADVAGVQLAAPSRAPSSSGAGAKVRA